MQYRDSSCHRRGAIVLLLAVAFSPGFSLPLHAQAGLGFTRIADNNTVSPSGGGNFGTFGRPVIDGDTVTFWNFTATQEGIYKSAGGTLSVVADRNTSMPHTTGNFTHFGQPSLSGDRISFWSEWMINNMFSGMEGVYSTGGPGGIIRVADRTTDIPGGGGEKFNDFDPIPSVSNGLTTFYGGNISDWGVYQGTGGPPSFLIGPSTAIPGGAGNFTGTVGSSLEGDTLVFKGIGTNSQQGVYTFTGGLVSRLADKTTQVPAASVNFKEFGFPTRSGSQTLFIAIGADNYQGIYRHDGASLLKVIDRNTPVPSANSGTFAFQNNLGLGGETRLPVDSNGNAAFAGGSAFNAGYFLYTASTGTIALIMRADARIENRQVTAVHFSEQAISGRKIALLANFAAGGAGLYTVEIASYARNVSGPWDTAANWSFDAVPGPESSTLLSTGVNVTGPVAAATVRSLEMVSYVVNPSILSLQESGPLTATEGVHVNFNGILAGSGSLTPGAGKSVLISGNAAGRAVLSPGHTGVGTINIGGRLVFGDDSDLRIDLTAAGPCDLVNVTGDLDLSSNLKRIVFVTGPGGVSGNDYTLLTYTGTRTGTFPATGIPPGYTLDHTTPGKIILKAPPVTDSDHDNIPDAWEIAQAGNLTTLTATGDADSDGYSDVSEYIADTGALDASRFLQITAFRIEPYIEEPDPEDPDGEPYEEVEVFVTWSGRSACRYAIATATSPSGPWVTQDEDIVTGNGPAKRTL